MARGGGSATGQPAQLRRRLQAEAQRFAGAASDPRRCAGGPGSPAARPYRRDAEPASAAERRSGQADRRSGVPDQSPGRAARRRHPQLGAPPPRFRRDRPLAHVAAAPARLARRPLRVRVRRGCLCRRAAPPLRVTTMPPRKPPRTRSWRIAPRRAPMTPGSCWRKRCRPTAICASGDRVRRRL